MKRSMSIWMMSAAAFLGSQFAAQAITTTFNDRTAWENAFVGPFWDVDLGGPNNGLIVGDTLEPREPIKLPPLFNHTLSFDRILEVIKGVGWNNYITPGGGDPLVLLGTMSLTGTLDEGQEKFGFEVQANLSDTVIPATISVTLSDGTVFSYNVGRTLPTFFGWVSDAPITYFTVTSDSGDGISIGNFVVPEGGATLQMIGFALLAIMAIQRRSSILHGSGSAGPFRG